MQENQKTEAVKKVGEPGYINKNCWLVRNLNYSPAKHCQYCELKFSECIFEHYLVVSVVLVSLLLLAIYLIDKNISKSIIISIFVLVMAYGYFFDRSTEKIIQANFAERKAKEAYKDLSEHLQQKVDEQTKDLARAYAVEKKANEELKTLDKVKDQFLMQVQHDLRSPLGTVKAYCEMLADGTLGKLSKKSLEAVQRMYTLAESKLKEVNTFLDVSQFQLGKGVLSLKPDVDVLQIFGEIFKELGPQAKSKGIYLKLEKIGKIFNINADKEKLKAAILNMVDNCIKYTPEGGVEVKLKIEDGKLIIRMTDTGIGVPPEKVKAMFESPFERSEQAQKMTSMGKGIGLYLSSQIIKAHKGKIWAESKGEGKGTACFIELPTT